MHVLYRAALFSQSGRSVCWRGTETSMDSVPQAPVAGIVPPAFVRPFVLRLRVHSLRRRDWA
jgi:hypothetical protein